MQLLKNLSDHCNSQSLEIMEAFALTTDAEVRYSRVVVPIETLKKKNLIFYKAELTITIGLVIILYLKPIDRGVI